MPASLVRIDDPKKASAEKKFSIGSAGAQSTTDLYQFVSLFFGLAGIFLKMRLFLWQGLFFCIVSFLTGKQVEGETKQVFSSFSITLVGLAMSYMGPQAALFQ
ncbi:hypothetical protein PROFUN_07234 [Planoprotostelium fungivorum]|uniref:Protein Asterix n=1 Tax=Planoprotostelium fungivorum TaxID=1890364 RepID=A0A2P6NM65_9EUKA|nr:hypothetical protein PROFUN_07234 [Planoprotostelium fungivorum]